MTDARLKRRWAADPPTFADGVSAAERLNHWTGDPDFMLSLARGLLVLHAVARAGRQVSIAEVAARTGLSRPTARRCVHTLSALGYVRADDAGGVAGPLLASLTTAHVSSSPLISGCGPVLDRLRDQIDETASLWAFDGDEAIYVARADGGLHFRLNLQVGVRRRPLYCTSIGRVLLAFRPQPEIDDYLVRTELAALTPRTVTSPERLREILAEIRRQGYAIGDQEAEMGLRSVTVPVRDGRGEVVAALNVGTHAAVVGLRELRSRILPRLLEAAAALSALLSVAPSERAPAAPRPSPSKRISDAARLDYWAGDPSFMVSLARGLLVLHAVAEAGRAVSVSEVAAATGLSRATARRCVYTLGALGYLQARAERSVAGPRLESLTSAYISTAPLFSGYGPILDRLHRKLEQTTALWIYDGGEAIYAAHRDADRLFKINPPIGARAPLYCTSAGRVFLAYRPQPEIDDYLAGAELAALTPRTVTAPERLSEMLGEVRRRGYAIADQQMELGLRSIAAPVRDGRGDVVAAIEVAVQSATTGLRAVRTEILPPLLEAAAELSALLP